VKSNYNQANLLTVKMYTVATQETVLSAYFVHLRYSSAGWSTVCHMTNFLLSLQFNVDFPFWMLITSHSSVPVLLMVLN